MFEIVLQFAKDVWKEFVRAMLIIIKLAQITTGALIFIAIIAVSSPLWSCALIIWYGAHSLGIFLKWVSEIGSKNGT